MGSIMFKMGDQVRIIRGRSAASDLHKGKTGLITAIKFNSDVDKHYYELDMSGWRRSFWYDEVELYNTEWDK